MEIKEILKTVDHTLLLPASTWSEIKEILDDAMKYDVSQLLLSNVPANTWMVN